MTTNLALLRDARGEVLTEDDVRDTARKIQQQHEKICFGLFLPGEIDYLFKMGEAGPILRNEATYRQHRDAGPVPPQLGVLVLGGLLKRYREVANALIRETARIAAKHSGRAHCLDSTPEAVAARFREAKEWVEALQAKANKRQRQA